MSFGATENAEGHPWVTIVQNNIHETLFTDVFRRVPLLKLFPGLIKPKSIQGERKENLRLNRERIKQRMAMGNNREDFFGHLLGEKGTDLTLEFLTAQANTLLIAGSETTATFLAGMQSG
jgi:cytochrome P450